MNNGFAVLSPTGNVELHFSVAARNMLLTGFQTQDFHGALSWRGTVNVNLAVSTILVTLMCLVWRNVSGLVQMATHNTGHHSQCLAFTTV